MDWPATITAASGFVTALATLVVAIATFRRSGANKAAIAAVHREVKTGNGQTLAALADATEARRVRAIAAADRTADEQGYLDDQPPPSSPPAG